MQRILLSWSSGKDSAWTLWVLRQRGDVEVVGLFTTINEEANRVAMHAVRDELLQRQADAAGLPLHRVAIPAPCSNEQYETVMTAALAKARQDGVDAVAFGDLFLEDIRRYREERMAPTGIGALFPLWGIPTGRLARTMVEAGLRAHVTVVDPAQIDPSFLGQTFDGTFLGNLPPTVDPCGERGEFHTFAWSGPMFRGPIAVTPGETVVRDGFWFADLLPS